MPEKSNNKTFKQRLIGLSENIVVQSIFFIVLAGAILALTSDIISRFFGHYINAFLPYLHGELWLIILAYTIYIFFQAMFFFLPVTPADIALFAITGPLLVFIFNLIGTIAGYCVDYYIARRYGKNLLKRILPLGSYQKIEKFSHQMTWKKYFVLTAIPINHPDIMAYTAGLTKIKFKTAIAILTFIIAIRLFFTLFILNAFWIGH